MLDKFKGLFANSPESQTALRVFLRIEAGVFLLGALAMYAQFSGAQPQWGLFVLFVILPETAWFAYLYRGKSSRVASLIYDAVHSYVAPIALLIVLWPYKPLFLLGWVANIGLLRVLGLGFHAPRRA